MKFLLTLSLCLSLGMLTGCQPNSGTHDQEPDSMSEAAPVSAGHTVFLEHCMMCHIGAGDPPGPNEIITGSAKLESLESFKAYVRQPDNGSMPPFSQTKLPDADLAVLYEYLKNPATN